MINSNKIKAILFDLDGTLLNSKTAEYNAICDFKKMFKEFDTINEKEFAELWSKIITELYDKYLKGEISFEKQRIERIKKLFSNFNLKVKDEEAKKKFEIYLDLYKKNWSVFDDVTEVIEKLKDKYKLAIVTNGDSSQQREKIERIGVKEYFSEIIISSEAGFAKPNKEIFEIVCKNLKIEPRECIMIGDDFNADIKGGINSGIKSIWVNRKNENIQYEYKIKELKEILKFL